MSEQLRAFIAASRRKSQAAKAGLAGTENRHPNHASKFEQKQAKERARRTQAALEATLKPGHRVQAVAPDTAFGTVRYIGVLEGAPEKNAGAKWVGVEWDDIDRGTQADGSKFGISYFECKTGCSASFVKARKLRAPRSFADVLAEWRTDIDAGLNAAEHEAADEGAAAAAAARGREHDSLVLKSRSLADATSLVVSGSQIVRAGVTPPLQPDMSPSNDGDDDGDDDSGGGNAGACDAICDTQASKQPPAPAPTSASLEASAVAPVPAPSTQVIELMLPRLRELDLASNLFDRQSGWHQLALILRVSPNLAFLNISSNHLGPVTAGVAAQAELAVTEGALTRERAARLIFDLGTSKDDTACALACALGAHLRTLVVNDCGVDWPTVRLLVRLLPALRELSLAANQLPDPELLLEQCSSDGCLSRSTDLQQLRVLRLANNQVQSWARVCQQLQFLPQLRELVLSDNPLCGLAAATEDAADADWDGVKPFAQLRSLYVSGTCIDSWADVDAIGRLPALRDVRLARVPLSDPLNRPVQSAGGDDTVGNGDAGAGVGPWQVPLLDAAVGGAASGSSAHDRMIRALLVARLPNVAAMEGGAGGVESRRGQTIGKETCGLLNRSAISDCERRDAEKFLVAHMQQHCSMKTREADARYLELVEELRAREGCDTEADTSSWVELVDESSGEKYYRNRVTGETRWDAPPELVPLPPPPELSAPPAPWLRGD